MYLHRRHWCSGVGVVVRAGQEKSEGLALFELSTSCARSVSWRCLVRLFDFVVGVLFLRMRTVVVIRINIRGNAFRMLSTQHACGLFVIA